MDAFLGVCVGTEGKEDKGIFSGADKGASVDGEALVETKCKLDLAAAISVCNCFFAALKLNLVLALLTDDVASLVDDEGVEAAFLS